MHPKRDQRQVCSAIAAIATAAVTTTAPAAAATAVVPRDLGLGFIDFDFAAVEAGTIESWIACCASSLLDISMKAKPLH
jgi:hypothetical protein